MFNIIVRWIVFSSKNPAQASLTIKGVLLATVPMAMSLAGLAHIDIGQEQLTDIFDTLAGLVQVGLSLAAIAMTGVGLLRKLWATIRAHQAEQ